MRISINCISILSSHRTGIGRYTYHLLDSLGRLDQSNEYILHGPQNFFNFSRHLPSFTGYPNLRRYPDYLNWGVRRCDIYHFPSPSMLRMHRGKLIVTLHDLIYKTFPQTHTAQTIEMTQKHMEAIASRADAVICVSENTRRDLHSFFNISPEKSCVIYNGVDHRIFYPLSDHQRLAASASLKNMGVNKPYVLYVGTIEPRKNLNGLLESFAMLKSRKVFEGQLVVAGDIGWMSESREALIKKLGIEKDVVFTSFVSDEQLCQLYNMTELFVLPSFYEGFGFPIVEAFCCGAVVVTSKTSACAEIAGQAALTIDPQDPTRIAQAMEQALTDKNLKKSLRQVALSRAKEFSFDKTAQATLALYQRLAR